MQLVFAVEIYFSTVSPLLCILYFSTLVPINKGTELLVWYGEEYALDLGIDLNDSTMNRAALKPRANRPKTAAKRVKQIREEIERKRL